MPLQISRSLSIPDSELGWRFSRSSGPGGQHVNTSDSRVELFWNIPASAALSDAQRTRLMDRLAARLVDGAITVSAAERRSQLRNREIASEKLADIVRAALAPEPAKRRPSKPTRGSRERRLAAKKQRSAVKQQRQRPPGD
ncbi:alternative ribosome rescue aminoacyl-tRNA hydrolase ArfB [Saxibacter everestensis]|uniref:Alternative ribosome rescue aminoacyl-tRNA hydrolase ArfB n=1 Tax=Saxibacter everestensis TaxID=2909229 RepID=A0ABY8QVM8_9MICO|nr:alternative ribosome rescue aminoacyl-tRNA hydrolase ArfB [Brevibacteriaceae bacterium ZFBP1038]